MPSYDYEAKGAEQSCDYCRSGFEMVRGMNDPDPTECPKCGSPIRRKWLPTNVSGGQWSTKRLLNKDNLHKHGFKTGTDLLESGEAKID